MSAASCRLAGLLAAAMLGLAGPAWADACGSHNWNGGSPSSIPNCELQVQAPLKLSAWESKGWTFHCTGDHPYYWGLAFGWSPSYTFDNTCFTVPENAAVENNDTNKFDATFTNWCLKSETVTVTLACSDTPP
ncbi:hypothetical protein [Geminicoccus harenae]|uniref:hypothetical protein n=1 Tax=Geminicoccus harenae TaxID=2498453 RepID=UPI00168B2B97|nr:hypothetical protein [Geminicoccus harenae]